MRKILLMLGIVIGVLLQINAVKSSPLYSGDDCAAEDGKSVCHWEIDDNGKLSISGTGLMKDFVQDEYSYGVDHSRPWFQYADFVNEVDIQGVSSIGGDAFDGFTNITKVSMSDTVETIGKYAFRESPIESLTLSQNLKSIERYAFQNNKLSYLEIPDNLENLIDGIFYSSTLAQIVVPDSVKSLGYNVFGSNVDDDGNSTLHLDKLKIVCKGDVEKCKAFFDGYTYWWDDGRKGFSLAGNVIPADGTNCNSLNYFWNGIECVSEPDMSKRACCPVCVDLDGYCSRIRYTLPEADELTSNDNENMIEWIFE